MPFLNKLETSVVPMDLIWKNLEQTRQTLKRENLNDYWLNSDGSISPKKKWLHRLIRWIQNLLWNKTASDIWHLFRRIIESQVHHDHKTEKKSIGFVVRFLKSRKDRLQNWFHSHPKEFEFLETQLKQENQDPCILKGCEKVYSFSLKLNMQAQLTKTVNSTLTGPSNSSKFTEMSCNTPWLKHCVESDKNLSTLRDCIKNRNENNPNLQGVKEDKIPQFYEKINSYLNDVLSDCERGVVSQEEVCRLLTTFSEPSPQNDLVRLENFCKNRELLSDKNRLSVKDQTLKDVRELKEKVFLDLFKERPYHIFNTFKLRYAKKLGLDDGFAQFDPFAQSYKASSFSDEMTALNHTLKEMKKSFLEAFHGSVLSGVKEQIQKQFEKGNGKAYVEFLVQCLYSIDKSPENYIKSHYLNKAETGLNSAGVAILLKQVGVLGA